MLATYLKGATANALNLTLVAYASGDDTTTITIPSGVQDGDIGVLWDTYTQTSARTLVVPNNWSSLSQTQTGPIGSQVRYGQVVSYRLLTLSLAETSVTGMNESLGLVSKVLYIFRPNKSIASVSISSVDIKTGTTATTNPVTASTISGGQAHLAGFATNSGRTVSYSFTPTDDQPITISTSRKNGIAIMPSGNTTAQLTSITGTTPTYSVQTCFSLTFNT
jgi:hypothetical protein